MIIIESKHIMDAIRKECPITIKGSLDRITILPPKTWGHILGILRFETSEGEQTVDAHWFISVMPEATILTIKYPVVEKVTSIEL